jgi:hypothetical protein
VIAGSARYGRTLRHQRFKNCWNGIFPQILLQSRVYLSKISTPAVYVEIQRFTEILMRMRKFGTIFSGSSETWDAPEKLTETGVGGA